MPRPVFVVSAPRSGSTFVVALLDSHPRIAMTNEAAWVTFLRKAHLLASTPSMRAIDDGEGFQTPGILPERYVADFAASFAAMVRPFVAELFRRVAGDCDWYGDKVMSCNDLAFAIQQFPEAAFVQLVRDPRDVIASTYAFQNKQPTSWQGATFEARVGHMVGFLRDTAAMLAGRHSLLLRYEELVTDSERRTRELFAFLGLDVAPPVRAFLHGEAKRLFGAQGTSASPDASIGRWRQDLTPAQQAAAQAALADQLRRLGYPEPQ
jgi:sulfotransferase family protein